VNTKFFPSKYNTQRNIQQNHRLLITDVQNTSECYLKSAKAIELIINDSVTLSTAVMSPVSHGISSEQQWVLKY